MNEAGADNKDLNAIGCYRITQSGVESVQSSLGGPIDEVGLPWTLTGHRRHGDDRPMPLFAKPLGDQDAASHRSRVIDLHKVQCSVEILPRALLVT
jgi:hypothetical protein